MPAVNPPTELVKLPNPVPLLVLESSMVGFGLVPQQTPLSVIAEPPSIAMLPPHTAVFFVMDDTEEVEMVAKLAVVVNWISFP